MDQDTRIAGPEPPAVKNATDARQGADRAPIHYVLFGGLALAAVAFILMFTVR